KKKAIQCESPIMPVLEILTSSGVGSLLGMRHALEPDHLAAVSTLVSREQSTVKAAMLGAWWGIGHTLSLLAVGTLLVLLRAEMPHAVADAFELAVALMLIVLGGRTLLQAVRSTDAAAVRSHRRGWMIHQHPGMAAHVHLGRWTLAPRPLLIGAI